MVKFYNTRFKKKKSQEEKKKENEGCEIYGKLVVGVGKTDYPGPRGYLSA